MLDAELQENLTVNKSLTLIGGYNTTYTGRTGQRTVLHGKLLIRGGMLTVNGVAVK